KTHMSGPVSISIKDLEYFDSSQAVYIFDSETNIYHNLQESDFTISLAAGVYDRFSLRFTSALLNVNNNSLANGISITHSKSDSMLNILNNLSGVDVQKLDLYNIVGQHIKSIKVEEGGLHHIRIP